MCASSLVAGWWGRRWSLEEVREMLGHSSVLVTERYAHFAEARSIRPRVRRAAAKVPRTDGGASPSSVAAIRSDIADLVSVGRAGLEPATYGLKGLAGAEELRGVNPDLILRGSLVRRVLDLAARHDPATADEMMRAMRALASTVLAADEVRLAREVLEGGRFAGVKAVELAERLLPSVAGTIPIGATRAGC
jgi:hypothetical protein